MNLRKSLIFALLMLSLLVGAGAALAQDDGSYTSDAPTWRYDGPRGPHHQRDHWRGDHARGPVRLRFGSIVALELMEEYTGLTLAELRQARQDGQTLAALIEANDRSVEAFVAEALEKVDARLATAVENGRLTEDEAAALREEIEARLWARINGETCAYDYAGQNCL